jgi:hypothetical protein
MVILPFFYQLRTNFACIEKQLLIVCLFSFVSGFDTAAVRFCTITVVDKEVNGQW